MLRDGRILVVGGGSVIGAALARRLERMGFSVLTTTRRSRAAGPGGVYLDLEHAEEWKGPSEHVDAAVICAGVTKIEDCRAMPQATARVNVEGVVCAAGKLIGRGAKIIYLSTSQVFGGEKKYPAEDDAVSPITEYGRQKAEAERRLRETGGDGVVILRLTKVLGAINPLFDRWARALRAGERITAFTDMPVSPVPMSSVTSVTALLLARGSSGVYHLSGDRDVSYAKAAAMMARAIGVDEGLVNPVTAESGGAIKEPFPKRTALGMGRIRKDFGIVPPDVEWTIGAAASDPAIVEGDPA